MKRLLKCVKAEVNRGVWAVAAVTAWAVGMGSTVCHASYVDAVLADNPVAYYRLNEAAEATTASSEVGGMALQGTYAYNGTGAGPGVPGVPGSGFEIGNTAMTSWVSAGNVARVVVGDDAALDITGNLTIEAWIYRTAQSGDSNDNEGIATKYVGGGNQRSYAFYYSAAAGTIGLAISPDGTAASTVFHVPAEATIAEEQWTHVVAVFEAGARMELYIDGQPAGTPTTTGVPTGIHAGAADFWIGGLPTLSSQRMFEGNIDEVAIYAEALSSEQILAHYTASVPEPGTFWLIMLGASGMAACRWKRRR